MPDGMTFWGADPVNGEPLPASVSDVWAGLASRYAFLGHRLTTRGWCGSVTGSTFASSVEATWRDVSNRPANDTRGGWTGIQVAVMNMFTREVNYFMSLTHGKRLGDPGWNHYGYYCDMPRMVIAETAGWILEDGIQESSHGIITGGISPANSMLARVYQAGAWVDVHSAAPDFLGHLGGAAAADLGLIATLFSGSTKAGAPISLDTATTYFKRLSLSMFEPFVLDVAQYSMRDLESHLESMAPGYTPVETYAFEVERPRTDLFHVPTGSTMAPIELRKYDDDIGWCVGMGSGSTLGALGVEDTRYVYLVAGAARDHVPCATAWAGSDCPVAILMRLKMRDLALITATRNIITFGSIHAVGPTDPNNGIGLLMKYAGGTLTLTARCYDGAGAWADCGVVIDPTEWEGRAVDIALAWTGCRGREAGRPSRELRLIVDGRTVASVVVPGMRLDNTRSAMVGRNPPTVNGLAMDLRLIELYADPLRDEDIMTALDRVAGPINPSFEIAGDRNGEAQGWEWQCWQTQCQFATFNGYDPDQQAWILGREEFGCGYAWPYAWRYADEAARLAAVGFVAADVGKAALQEDTDEMYVLSGIGPIVWTVTDSGQVHDWAWSLVGTAAMFCDAPPGPSKAFARAMEGFGIQWDALGGLPGSGVPWPDFTLISLWETTPPTGWSSWYDVVGHAPPKIPVYLERWSEGWGTDPYETAGGAMWVPGGGVTAIQRGKAITFPVMINATARDVYLYGFNTGGADSLIRLRLTQGSYATAAALAAALNVLWVAEVGGATSLTFGTWSEGGQTGLTFGWNGVAHPAATLWWAFGIVEGLEYRDARTACGLVEFGINGNESHVVTEASLCGTKPSDVANTDRILSDVMSLVEYDTDTCPYTGLQAFPYGWAGAIFDIGLVAAYAEMFIVQVGAWYGAWILNLTDIPITQALFDTGVHTLETFLDVEWPDELWP
jgi:hypothetical protein